MRDYDAEIAALAAKVAALEAEAKQCADTVRFGAIKGTWRHGGELGSARRQLAKARAHRDFDAMPLAVWASPCGSAYRVADVTDHCIFLALRPGGNDPYSRVTGTAFEALCDYCDTHLPWEYLPAKTPITCPICWAVYTECRATKGVTYAGR